VIVILFIIFLGVELHKFSVMIKKDLVVMKVFN